MNKLRAYLNRLNMAQREQFCFECQTSLGYLRKALSAKHRLGPALCTAVERATRGDVTRRDLRPDDWHVIWPELAQQKETA